MRRGSKFRAISAINRSLRLRRAMAMWSSTGFSGQGFRAMFRRKLLRSFALSGTQEHRSLRSIFPRGFAVAGVLPSALHSRLPGQ